MSFAPFLPVVKILPPFQPPVPAVRASLRSKRACPSVYKGVWFLSLQGLQRAKKTPLANGKLIFLGAPGKRSIFGKIGYFLYADACVPGGGRHAIKNVSIPYSLYEIQRGNPRNDTRDEQWTPPKNPRVAVKSSGMPSISDQNMKRRSTPS